MMSVVMTVANYRLVSMSLNALGGAAAGDRRAVSGQGRRRSRRGMMSVVMTVADCRLVSMSLNALGVRPQETDGLSPRPKPPPLPPT